jgi:hypothetical protein
MPLEKLDGERRREQAHGCCLGSGPPRNASLVLELVAIPAARTSREEEPPLEAPFLDFPLLPFLVIVREGPASGVVEKKAHPFPLFRGQGGALVMGDAHVIDGLGPFPHGAHIAVNGMAHPLRDVRMIVRHVEDDAEHIARE